MKDIIVFLPSRDNPKKCNDTIDMLYRTCASKDNFDIACIVDDDQKGLYSKVIALHPEVIWIHPKHEKSSFNNIMQIHFDFIEEHDYYFNWWVSDDFWGLTKSWDSAIAAKKDIFKDRLYTLYTNNPMSRNLNALSSQFRKAYHWRHGKRVPMVTDPVELIYHYHEMLPVCTKEWRLLMKQFYDKGVGGDHVFFNAAIAHILSVRHGYSRSIEVDFHYKGIADSGNASAKKYNGMSRDQHFYNWAKYENFNIILPVAESAADYIWKFYRKIMDDARKPSSIDLYKVLV
tara:strand:- start:62 stop:925 length:864 start_codon:yes stop_codon:yes gene_type:complete